MSDTVYKSIAEIRQANNNLGCFFFERDTMMLFGSKVFAKVYHGQYFITSEKFSSECDCKRRYSVRKCADGRISTIGDFQEYATLDAAKEAVRLMK